jgi:putative FmdB family regulatory protein
VPIYEYQCQKCKRLFEYMQSMSEAPKKKCEKCGGKLEKQMSAAGFVLKGGGWYKDLYASSKPGDGGSSESSGGNSSTESKSDSGGDKAEKADKSEKKAEKAEKKAEKKPAKSKSSKGR